MNRAIDLFSGAGGLSLGLKIAGWEVKVAVEFDAIAIATHELNFPKARHICSDISTIDFRPFRGQVDLVAGGPPCQPFSVSGKQLGKRDSRDMLPQFVRAVRECQPTAFLMENVAGLASPRFATYLEERLAELRVDYEVACKVLNAADYGVPQNRHRVFVIGVRKGMKFDFPLPTHGPEGGHAYVATRKALAGCPRDARNCAKVVYAKNPILRKSWTAGMLLNGKGRPLNLSGPSHTIPATAGGNRTHILDPKGVLKKYHQHLMKGGKPRKGEVDGCTRLTVRQSARLQAFPDTFQFTGRRNQQYAQIGNAVPPQLAAVVGRVLLVELLRHAPGRQLASSSAASRRKILATA